MSNKSVSYNLAKAFLGKKVAVTIDRPLGSIHPKHGFVYEVNYGYIAGVNAPDGEDLDAYYIGVDVPLQNAQGRCVAIVHREDDDDDKLVVVPDGIDITDDEIMSAISFQEKWFQSRIVRE